MDIGFFGMVVFLALFSAGPLMAVLALIALLISKVRREPFTSTFVLTAAIGFTPVHTAMLFRMNPAIPLNLWNLLNAVWVSLIYMIPVLVLFLRTDRRSSSTNAGRPGAAE